VLPPNALDDGWREYRRPSRGATCSLPAARFAMFVKDALELVDWDEALAPGQLDRLDGRNDPAIDCREADSERFGSLPTGVRKSLNLRIASSELAACIPD